MATTTTTTTTLSSFSQAPTKVIESLEDGDVVLIRRSAADLRLSRVVDSEREVASLALLAQLIAASLDDEMSACIAGHLTDVFPWLEFLPEASRRRFVGEFLRVARACASVGRFDRLAVTVASWQGTAEAYADPDVTPDGHDLKFLEQPSPVADPA